MRKHLLPAIIGVLSLSLLSCASAPPHKGLVDSEGMVLIDRGWFYMGYDEGKFNEAPQHEVMVAAFRLDAFEVTAQEFSLFLNDKGNPDDRYFTCDEQASILCYTKEGKPAISGTGEKASRYLPRPGYEKFPANNVSWYGAEGFCRWKGKRLPKEAEWEKAARGEDKRLYPWGNRPPDDLKSRYDKEWGNRGIDVLLPVDSLPAGRSDYGVYNMAGNILEWIHDWYRQNYCNFCDPGGADYMAAASEISGLQDKITYAGKQKEPDLPPREDAEGPPVGSFKVLRGGSWFDNSSDRLRSSYRFWLDPAERFAYTGVRCAVDQVGKEESKSSAGRK